MLGCSGPWLTPDEAAFFAEAQPLGFILFARNIEGPDQLRRLTGDLRAAVGRDAPILIDQEGGRVQRLTPPHWRRYLPPLDQVRAAGPDKAARSMWLRARLIAEELRAVGLDVNCTPCADIARPETHPFLLNRCYGFDAETVAQIARAVADGSAEGGVQSVLKHIPGHGRAQVDSHLDLPRVSAPRAALAEDFAPFRALNDLPFAMTAHIVYDAIDPDLPATLSPAMIALIRDEIGFDGVLMTDDISMQALSGGIAEICSASLAAGCDTVLHCNGDLSEMQQVAAACGPLSDAARARAEAALAQRRAPVPVDIAALEAELEALVKGAVAHV
nr:glycoside hydrolase family 3 protein [Actibacterium sp. MT2.3-13A]